MSHVSVIKTPALVDREILSLALLDMEQQVLIDHLQIGAGVSQVTDYHQIVIGEFAGLILSHQYGPQGFALEFDNEAGSYQIKADLYTGRKQVVEAFMVALGRKYVYHATVQTLAAQGYSLVSEQYEEDGTLVLELM